MTTMSQFLFITLLLLMQDFTMQKINLEAGTPCGMLLLTDSRIIGGRAAIEGEVPWIAGLIIGMEYRCAASIIAKRWIITAAHCVNGFEQQALSVRVGSVYLKMAVSIPVERAFIHPSYNSPRKYSNDIALLKLQRDIVFNNVTWPICLDRKKANLKNRFPIIAGWGTLREVGERYPKMLQLVRLPILDNKKCQEMFTFDKIRLLIVEDTQICAGFRHGKHDACQGDSGGPQYIETKRHSHILIGVISHGIGCAQPGLPGLYARVNSYISWIDSVMQN